MSVWWLGEHYDVPLSPLNRLDESRTSGDMQLNGCGFDGLGYGVHPACTEPEETTISEDKRAGARRIRGSEFTQHRRDKNSICGNGLEKMRE